MKQALVNISIFLGFMLSNSGYADWLCEVSCRGCGLRGTYSEAASSRSAAIEKASFECKTRVAELGCGDTASISVNSCVERGAPSGPIGPQHYNISFRNLCLDHGKIWTAIHRLNLDGTWEVAGFWGLEYAEIARVGSTRNRTFFIHGHTDANVTWGSGSGPWTVRGKSLPFTKVTIPEGTPYGDYQFKFTCN